MTSVSFCMVVILYFYESYQNEKDFTSINDFNCGHFFSIIY